MDPIAHCPPPSPLPRAPTATARWLTLCERWAHRRHERCAGGRLPHFHIVGSLFGCYALSTVFGLSPFIRPPRGEESLVHNHPSPEEGRSALHAAVLAPPLSFGGIPAPTPGRWGNGWTGDGGGSRGPCGLRDTAASYPHQPTASGHTAPGNRASKYPLTRTTGFAAAKCCRCIIGDPTPSSFFM